MPYYAHTDGTNDMTRWELLPVHVKNVANQAEYFAEKFQSGKWGFLLGLWHDIGKYHPEFQKKLAGLLVKCSHSPAGAYWGYMRGAKVSKEIGYIIANVIGGHHSGLHDRDALNRLLNEIGKLDWASVEPQVPNNVREYPIPPIPAWLDITDHIARDMWVRFLFSSLVDADWLMTERYCDIYRSIKREENIASQSALRDLLGPLERYLASISKNNNPVNIVRSQVSQQCLAAAYGQRGAYSCTVPTGGGKTISVMRFALHHAVHHGMSRIIVVVPFTSIIDQNADVYTNILGIQNVLEHHSNVDIEKKRELARKEKHNLSYFANENWDVPVVVTTNVQFFESIFSRKTSRLRKVHNIANSVIVFDEAQLFPTKYVEPIISVLKTLVAQYGCSIVCSTATQPPFDDRFIRGGGIQAREIIPDPAKLASDLKRVRVHWPKHDYPTTWEVLAKRIVKAGRQSLAIVNLRQDARDLATALKPMTKAVPVFHLSALMCPEHRRNVIKVIKERLEKAESCRVVSTQLIEAGVDIDFPVVFRAMIGLDSIAQAAGRCNREGKRKLGHVWLFHPESSPPRGVLQDGLNVTMNMLLAKGRKIDPTDPNIQAAYFKALYNSQDLDQENINPKKKQGDFKKVHDDFKVISDETFTVMVPWGKKGEALLLELLHAKELEKRHLRAIQPFTVSIYKKSLDRLQSEGIIKQLIDDGEGGGIWYVDDMSGYDEEFGLDA